MEGLLVGIGFVSLVLIALYPCVSFYIGISWLRDTHWSLTFARLGEEIFWSKRGDVERPLEGWERRLLAGMRPTDPSLVLRTDEGVVRAAAWLMGRRRSAVADAKTVKLIDALLARAVDRQIRSMESVPFGRRLGKTWRSALSARGSFIDRLSLGTFARAWAGDIIAQLGRIAAAALFIGAFVGLSWWVVNALWNESVVPVSADWTLVTGAVVTFVTIVTVAVVLTRRLFYALLSAYPRSTAVARRVIVVVVAVLLVFYTVDFTLNFMRIDATDWARGDTLSGRIVATVTTEVLLVAAVGACLRFSLRANASLRRERPTSARVVAMSCALYAAVGSIAIAVSALQLRIPTVVGWVLFSGIGIALVGLLAAAFIFIQERFTQWRSLSEGGLRLRRLGFREWQAPVGLILSMAPIVTALSLPDVGKGSTGWVGLCLLVVQLLSIVWCGVFGVLGVVFACRVGSAWQKKMRASDQSPTFGVVSFERLLHAAMMQYPLGSTIYGRASFIVASGDDEGTVMVGIPPWMSEQGD